MIDITNTNTKKHKLIHAAYGIYHDYYISIHFHLFTSYVTFYVHSFGRNKHRKRSFLIVSNDILYVFPLVILPFLISHTITSTKRPTPFHCSIELLLHIATPPWKFGLIHVKELYFLTNFTISIPSKVTIHNPNCKKS